MRGLGEQRGHFDLSGHGRHAAHPGGNHGRGPTHTESHAARLGPGAAALFLDTGFQYRHGRFQLDPGGRAFVGGRYFGDGADWKWPGRRIAGHGFFLRPGFERFRDAVQYALPAHPGGGLDVDLLRPACAHGGLRPGAAGGGPSGAGQPPGAAPAAGKMAFGQRYCQIDPDFAAGGGCFRADLRCADDAVFFPSPGSASQVKCKGCLFPF